jgi:uncharacterized Zn finger protein (UPF0148 family)
MAQAVQAPVVEEVKNCPACKKPLKKARRFYRNGAYYCNNNCFKKVQAEAKAKIAEAAAAKATEAAAAKAAEKSEEKPQV